MNNLKVITVLKFHHIKLLIALFSDCDASPPTSTSGAVSSSNTAVAFLQLILLNAYIMII